MAKTIKGNPHAGSSFDDFLIEDGIYEEVQARALKRALAVQLDRVLDPSNLSIQLDTLIKAASAVGKTVEIRLKRDTKRRPVNVT